MYLVRLLDDTFMGRDGTSREEYPDAALFKNTALASRAAAMAGHAEFNIYSCEGYANGDAPVWRARAVPER